MTTKDKSSQKKRSTPGEKRATDRRKETSKGYTYITMVGWMCRREKTRRKNDDFTF
ncbi:hypothetical protein [Desulfopila sp. IMCC35006]|uniref:hypothetical protein n=1 Tax=Desulfopila sp. IMCC35006 TaxID=2569542 RepID=UPI0012947CD6|nr:hypothetical protein [Desulfopila sp. IMCC35006]